MASEVRILIVNDNYINRLFMEKILGKRGIAFSSCINDAQAKEILEIEVFDMILMDVRVPIMDGYQLTIWLRAQSSNSNCQIPIIALTGSKFLGEKEKALKAGMNHHISKPFTPDTILSAIQQFFPNIAHELIDDFEFPDQLDKEKISVLYEGDWEHAAVIFEMFTKNIPVALSQLKIKIEQKRWAEVKYTLHKIKPNFALVGLGNIEIQIPKIEEMLTLSSFDEEVVVNKLNQLISDIKENTLIVKEGLAILSNLLNK